MIETEEEKRKRLENWQGTWLEEHDARITLEAQAEALKNRISEIELTLANIVDFLKITLPGGHGEGQL